MSKVLTKAQSAKLAKLTRAHVEATDAIADIPGPGSFNTKFGQATAEQRANHAASHRLGHRQREAVGEAFYTHPDIPNRAFPSRRAAAEAGVALSA